jgi:hypothetical protein
LALRVTGVCSVVAPGMAQVDAADKRQVGVGSVTVAENEHLLVMRAPAADALVEQRLAAAVDDSTPSF